MATGQWADGDFATPANLNTKSKGGPETIQVAGDDTDRSTRATAIQNAIDAATNNSKPFVFVPDNFLNYDASSVTFDSSVRMVREGQQQAGHDVYAYGAAGDGAIDDFDSFDAASSQAGAGGRVLIPGGDFFIGSELSPSDDGQTWIGEGAGFFQSDSATVLALNVGGSRGITVDRDYIRWVDLHIVDESGSTNVVQVDAGVQGFQRENVHIDGADNATRCVHWVAGAGGSVIYCRSLNCTARRATRQGEELTGDPNNSAVVNQNVWINCRSQDHGGDGWRINESARENLWLGCPSEGNTGDGYRISSRNNTILTPFIENNDRGLRFIDDGSSAPDNVAIIGALLQSNTTDYTNNSSIALIELGGSNVYRTILTNPAGLSIDGDIGFYGTSPTSQDTGWNPTNVTTDRSFDADSTSQSELADVLGTLINKLIDTGIIGS